MGGSWLGRDEELGDPRCGDLLDEGEPFTMGWLLGSCRPDPGREESELSPEGGIDMDLAIDPAPWRLR